MVSTSFSDAFVSSVAPHAAWVVEQLEAFNAFMPTGPWTADLDERVYRQGGQDLYISVLGSYDLSDHSWLWGWANPGWQGTPAVTTAEAVRTFGYAHGVREFTDDLVDLSAFDDPRMAAETLAFGAMGVLGTAGYLGVQANPDGRLYLIPDDPRTPRAAPNVAALPRTLITGVGVVGGHARQVVAGYFDHHGATQHPSPTHITAHLPGASTVDVTFDASDRITSVEIKAIGAG
jgi:uncharacterized protein DUF6882